MAWLATLKCAVSSTHVKPVASDQILWLAASPMRRQMKLDSTVRLQLSYERVVKKTLDQAEKDAESK